MMGLENFCMVALDQPEPVCTLLYRKVHYQAYLEAGGGMVVTPHDTKE